MSSHAFDSLNRFSELISVVEKEPGKRAKPGEKRYWESRGQFMMRLPDPPRAPGQPAPPEESLWVPVKTHQRETTGSAVRVNMSAGFHTKRSQVKHLKSRVGRLSGSLERAKKNLTQDKMVTARKRFDQALSDAKSLHGSLKDLFGSDLGEGYSGSRAKAHADLAESSLKKIEGILDAEWSRKKLGIKAELKDLKAMTKHLTEASSNVSQSLEAMRNRKYIRKLTQDADQMGAKMEHLDKQHNAKLANNFDKEVEHWTKMSKEAYKNLKAAEKRGDSNFSSIHLLLYSLPRRSGNWTRLCCPCSRTIFPRHFLLFYLDFPTVNS